MKNKFFASAVFSLVALSACVNRIPEEGMQTKEFTFRASIEAETAPFDAHTRSTDAVNSLAVFDCVGGKQVQTLSQSSASDGFGTFRLPLTYGTHELLFVGHKTEEPFFSYPSVTFNEAHDTFSFRLLLDVDEDTEASHNVQLSRAVALVKVVANDAIPADVSALRMKLSACHNTLDLSTGYASGQPSAATRTFTYNASHTGKTGSTYSIYTFVPDGAFTTDVAVEVLDAKGDIVSSSAAKGVSVERNRQTVLSGNVFGAQTEAHIEVNAAWDADINYPI